MTSATQRTIRELRNRGLVCAIVEKWSQFVGPRGVRQDLFGIVDVLALDPARGFVGVQSCATSFSEHYRKMVDERAEQCLDWLGTPGGWLELWGWRKVKLRRGSLAERWAPRVHVFKKEDFLVGREAPDEEDPIASWREP